MDLYSQRVSLKGYMVILALNSNFKIFVSEGTRYRFDAIHPYICVYVCIIMYLAAAVATVFEIASFVA